MDELRLRSRTVSELVDAAFVLYRRDMGAYMLLVAVANVPSLLVRLLMPTVVNPVNMVNPSQIFSAGTMITLLVTAVVSALSYAFASATVMKYSAHVYLGEDISLDQTARSVIPKVLPLIWANFLKALLYFLGFLCFFVGALYVWARWFGVEAAIVLEDKSSVEAFGRSSELSLGRKRHILNTQLLVYIIYFLLSFCVVAIAALAKSPVLTIIATMAYTIVAFPITILTQTVLYYDCRIRGEGFDLERMAASMDRPDTRPASA